MTDKTPQQSEVERVARAIEADLIRQASMQSGVEYTPADECGVASANMSLIPTELAQAALATLRPKVREAEVRAMMEDLRLYLDADDHILEAHAKRILDRLNQVDNFEGEE